MWILGRGSHLEGETNCTWSRYYAFKVFFFWSPSDICFLFFVKCTLHIQSLTLFCLWISKLYIPFEFEDAGECFSKGGGSWCFLWDLFCSIIESCIFKLLVFSECFLGKHIASDVQVESPNWGRQGILEQWRRMYTLCGNHLSRAPHSTRSRYPH